VVGVGPSSSPEPVGNYKVAVFAGKSKESGRPGRAVCGASGVGRDNPMAGESGRLDLRADTWGVGQDSVLVFDAASMD
jgi:hypothetical protein